MGLLYNPSKQLNRAVLTRPKRKDRLPRTYFPPVTVTPQLEETKQIMNNNTITQILEVQEPAPPKDPILPSIERFYIRGLILKYGQNYKKMSRDIKRNYYQLTPKQLEKKCLIYKQYYLSDQSWDRPIGPLKGALERKKLLELNRSRTKKLTLKEMLSTL